MSKASTMYSFKYLICAFLLALTFISQNTNAVELSTDGHGDAALLPYFSAKNDWQTFIRIINDSEFATVTKVRFNEAANGRTISDFVLFLGPYDQWNAWTDANAVDGSPGIRTNDTSCIFTVSPNQTPVSTSFESLSNTSTLKGAKFSEFGFTGDYDDGGNTSNTPLERLSEGQIEIIGIASLSKTSNNPSAARFAGFVTNDPTTGKPYNCLSAKAEYLGSLKGSEENLGYGSEFDFKNNMLVNAYLINVNSGQGASYDPSILMDFSDTSFISESISTETKPDLDSAKSNLSWTNNPRTIQHGITGNSLMTGGVDTLSTKFTRNSITNEWALKTSTNPSSTFKNSFTQWIVSFPTKQYYVDLQSDPINNDDISPTLADHSGNNDGWSPFKTQFVGAGRSCTSYSLHLRNIQGGASLYNDTSGLCHQTNVLSFGSEFANKGLASKFSTTVPASSLPLNPTYTATAKIGSAKLTFSDSIVYFALNNLTDDTGTTYHGLPVHGFMLYNFEATNQNSNYTTAQSHAYTRKTTVTP